jgi:ADP-ribose pyrophosphatase YjhB (NUDIX family)
MVLNEGANKYKHPGGHINLSESLLEGLKRELKEEIGLEIGDADPEKIFFDVVFKDGNAMINSIFQIQIDLETAKEVINNSPLPTNLFKLKELNEDNTWKSEINAIKFYEERNE